MYSHVLSRKGVQNELIKLRKRLSKVRGKMRIIDAFSIMEPCLVNLGKQRIGRNFWVGTMVGHWTPRQGTGGLVGKGKRSVEEGEIWEVAR